MSEASAREVLNKWKFFLSQNQDIRYKRKERIDLITHLAELCLEYNIPKEDALLLKRDVVNSLVTKEGMKGHGKYSDWKQNAAEEFDMIFSDLYLPDPKPQQKSISTQDDRLFIPEDMLIKKWIAHKFPFVSNEMIREAHLPGSCLNIAFLEDLLNE